MSKSTFKSLYPLIGAGPDEWNKLLASTEATADARRLKQAELAEWHRAILQTAEQIERTYASLETLITRESAAVDAIERKRRKSQTRLSLREFLSLPASSSDQPLRNLQLTSRSGSEMRLDALSFSGADHNVMNLNRARELFQQGKTPNAMWGLYYIRDGERSAGYGWDKPFLDEVYVHP